MFVTIKKPFKEIAEAMRPFEKIGIIGCSGCAAVCQTGGSKQIEEMADQLKEKRILTTLSVEEPCDLRILRRDLKRVAAEIAEVEALLILACGTGVQSVAAQTGKKCVAALDSHFVAKVESSGKFFERCLGCGDCVLNETAGICPRTLCPKGIMNGPCAEHDDGKCETDEQNDCVWHLIYEKLSQLGEIEKFGGFREPTDWSKRASPRAQVS